MYVRKVGRGSAVGRATRYGLDSSWIKSLWGESFRLIQTGPGAHPTSCTMGTDFLSLG